MSPSAMSLNSVLGLLLVLFVGVAALRLIWLLLGFMWRNALALVFGGFVCMMVLNSGAGPDSMMRHMRDSFNKGFADAVHARGHRLVTDPPEQASAAAAPEPDPASAPGSHRIMIDPKPGTYTFDMTQLKDDEQGPPANMNNNPEYGHGIH